MVKMTHNITFRPVYMINVVIVVYNKISMFHLSVPTAIFNDAALNNEKLFDVKICAEQKGQLSFANGLSFIVEEDFSIIQHADMVIFPSWEPEIRPSTRLINLITNLSRNNKMVVGLCLGAYALGYAGLLNGKRATTHWKMSDDFPLKFPQIHFESNPLYIVQDNIITSAGSAAAIDCCLYIVKYFYGIKKSNHIARMMVSSPERDGGQNQYIEHPAIERASDERLVKLIEYIQTNLTDDYSIEWVASYCAMSIRSFSRYFKANQGISFKRWLNNLRLNRSQELLESTALSITHISEQAGFSSEQIFRKHFKQRFDTTPNAWRNLFRSKNNE